MANIIEGSPTKQFFIDMITRDISIEDAIMDLIDNSIDGANRMRPEGHYQGLYIKIQIAGDHFSIEDNCGGFSLETAQKYAFRFGRPTTAPHEVNNSVGRFGIGMKRSLFKMGKKFVVETQHVDDHFKIDVDVDAWSAKVKTLKNEAGQDQTFDDWDFQCENIQGNRMPSDGTKIMINELNGDVKSLFRKGDFCNKLSEDIARILNFSLSKGVELTINNTRIRGKEIEMLMNENFKPYYEEGDRENVHYRIIAGLGKVGEPKSSGWYIFCNDRLVVEADQTSLTGWGVGYRQWHIEHAMFRGVIFLNSSETIKLPLTTTKKGIDATSAIYQFILIKMIEAMNQILPYLNSITKLKDKANDYRISLEESLHPENVIELKDDPFDGFTQKRFMYVPLNTRKWSRQFKTTRISYDADTELVEKAKDVADVRSNKDLGLLTFRSYIKLQGLDNGER